MKFCKSVLLALCAAPVALAFTPSNLGHHTNAVASFSSSLRVSSTAVRMSMSAKEVDTSDVSIPYDAAARLAYDEWRAKYDKGNFDNSRYPIFKANYEAITVANVVSKAQARQEGSEAPSLLTLNEFGDFTEEEYRKAMEKSQSSAATTTGDVLGKAMDAAQSQEEASSALKDAADALAEEEEALAKKLGLESVEELEAALDSMEGIAEDGGELESDNIAREARVRSAYLSWCKDNGKEPDENRFPAFSSNFLTMEKYSQETGKEMVLNKYADFTEQEYKAMQSSQKPAAEKRAVIPKATVVAEKSPEVIEAEREAERKAFEEAQAKRQQEIAAAEKKRAAYEEEMAQFQKKREEQAKKDAEKRAELLKQQAEARKRAEEEEKERRASIEKERAERQRKQELEKAKMEAEVAAAAIAAAKAAAQKEAGQVAERRAIDEKAFEIARQEAKAWEARQKKIAIKPSTPPPMTKPKPKPAPMPVASAPKPGISFFSSPKTAKTPPPKSAAVSFFSSPAPAPAAPKKAAPAFSFFNQPAAAPKPKKDVAREAEQARLERERIQQEANKKREQDLQAKKAAAEKVKAEAERKRIQAQKEQEARKKAAAAKSTPAPAPKPAAPTPVAKVAPPAFNFFGSPAPKAATPKPKPALSAPAPAAKKAPAPSFSFFGSPAPAPEPVKLPAIQAPPKPMASPFSFMGGSPKQATKKTPKPEAPTGEVPIRPGTMSLFTAQKKAAASKPKETQVPQRSGTLSLFGEKTAKKPEPKIPNRSGTLSIFGSATPPTKSAPKAEAAAPSRPTFSLFGGLSSGASAAPKVDPSLPVLTRWKQNPNGSITGMISNSKNFRTGTEITTSPVARGAKAGSVVKTGSGSQYFLK